MNGKAKVVETKMKMDSSDAPVVLRKASGEDMLDSAADLETVDVFKTEVKSETDSTNENDDLLTAPEHLNEEKNLHQKNMELYKKERDECDDEVRDLSRSEREKRLMELLQKCEVYSKYVLGKIGDEDEETRRIKDKNLLDRRSMDDAKPGTKRKQTRSSLPSKKAKVEERTLNGEAIPKGQPYLLSGGIMRDYQIKGYQWMGNLWQLGISGILADEMGLGKTIQTIGLICHLVEVQVQGPYLIVAPLSTITNWVKEFKKFAPSLPVVLYHGSQKERAEKRRQFINERHEIDLVEGEKRHCKNIFITSYEIAINDRPYFQRVQWRYIVVDEGHRLKNTNCRLIKELKLYTSHNRLLLTGTPLQNNLDELWSLLNFVMPDIFDDLRIFRYWFDAKEIDVGGEDEKLRILKQEQQSNILAILHKILTPFLLRRVKSDVDLKIPPKKEVLVYCPMSEKQRTFYEATVNKTIQETLKQGQDEAEEEPERDEKGRPKRSAAPFDYKAILEHENHESDKNFDRYLESLERLEKEREAKNSMMVSANTKVRETTDVKISLKNRLMDLRKSTNHPYLIEYPLTDDGLFYNTDENVVELCGKMKVLDQMLKELLSRKHKILIFSQMTRMLDILGDYFNFQGQKFSRLDGTMNFIDRQENIDKFNETEEVNIFLLSTRAGGLGINLTAADTCIIYDSDWNPQQDLQAQDRCHRIGQTNPVMVYRLVTANTIDERIVERAAAKRKLEKLIIHRNKFKSLESDDLKKTMAAISPQELLELLESRDHAGVVDRKEGPVFTKDELDQLLDRSDLTWAKIAEKEKENTRSNNRKSLAKKGRKSISIVPSPADSKKKAKTKLNGIFKVIENGSGSNTILP